MAKTGMGGMGVNSLARENWCGRVHFEGHSPGWRVLSKFSVQPWFFVSACTSVLLATLQLIHTQV